MCTCRLGKFPGQHRKGNGFEKRNIEHCLGVNLAKPGSLQHTFLYLKERWPEARRGKFSSYIRQQGSLPASRRSD